MGRQTRRVIKDRMSQEQLNALITRPSEPVYIEREHIEPRPILTYVSEYDSLHPEQTVKEFCLSIREMLSRYQGNKDQYSLLEQEMQDLLHYIEMGTDKNANIGYKLYKRLAEVRRERRICKNEIDLLQPIYDAFNDGEKLNVLSQLQGVCKATKQQIDNRCYTVRTDVLDTFIDNNKGSD